MGTATFILRTSNALKSVSMCIFICHANRDRAVELLCAPCFCDAALWYFLTGQLNKRSCSGGCVQSTSRSSLQSAASNARAWMTPLSSRSLPCIDYAYEWLLYTSTVCRFFTSGWTTVMHLSEPDAMPHRTIECPSCVHSVLI